MKKEPKTLEQRQEDYLKAIKEHEVEIFRLQGALHVVKELIQEQK